MTATPKETKYVSNIDYFGEPVYSYSLKQGIEDGFLAPFKVINVHTNIDDGWRPKKGQKDINGNEIEDREYNLIDYDYNIIIQDRIDEVAAEITKYLKETDRMSKTIVFCPTEDAADRMRVALNNLNTDMVLKDNQGNVKEQYVVRITGSDKYGKDKLDYFISVSQPYPVIATTSKLLSTGSDCKMVKLIVIDELINSMTEFKQIIGRGTRLRYSEGKTHFTIMDFRRVSRLFADPEWDGEIEQDEEFGSTMLTEQRMSDKENSVTERSRSDSDDEDEQKTEKRTVQVIGKGQIKVDVLQRLVSIYDTDGNLLKQESIEDYTKVLEKDNSKLKVSQNSLIADVQNLLEITEKLIKDSNLLYEENAKLNMRLQKIQKENFERNLEVEVLKDEEQVLNNFKNYLRIKY